MGMRRFTSVDEIPFEEGGKLGTQRRPVFYALQFLRELEGHASDGSGYLGPRLDLGGHCKSL
jgi:hypothetical protein